MLAPLTRTYLLASLTGNPGVMQSLLSGLATYDTRWDFKPDPERYSLREILVHLAATQQAWINRLVLTRDEDRPLLPAIDIDQMAATSGLTDNEPKVNLGILATRRQQYTVFLDGLDETQMARVALSARMGEFSIEDQAIFLLAHDGYHTAQIVEWLVLFETSQR